MDNIYSRVGGTGPLWNGDRISVDEIAPGDLVIISTFYEPLEVYRVTVDPTSSNFWSVPFVSVYFKTGENITFLDYINDNDEIEVWRP